ncbi:DinB family protein [Kribbella sp. NPDC048928]|uniref:DinB family protein n=1 Tax=Kribbella sp. NPDC048928 TaxID=3364111 RepID=UPI003711EACE
MIDEFAKTYLHGNLRWVRADLIDKVEGLSEYDVRRPLTYTGTNLLGLVKHLTMTEARYFGELFNRPYADPLPSYTDPHYANRDHLWVRAAETRAQIITNYHRACAHADATIDALPIDAETTVPWWPRPNVMLFNVLVHVLTESNRHAGHADILREQVHGASDADPTVNWPAHQAQIEQAARRAAPPGD